MILELVSMHLFAPFDQMELGAGKEGQGEAQQAYPSLYQWIHTQHARQAVWHAGQTLKSLRKLRRDEILPFHAVAAYHATLCLWIYSALSQQQQNFDVLLPSNTALHHEVLLDGEETLDAQRWISHNRGVPVISRETAGDGGCRATVKVTSSQALIQTVLRSVTARLLGNNSPRVENICHLMRVLSNINQEAV